MSKLGESRAGERVILWVRCAGSGGRCGRLFATVLEDGRVLYSSVRCHNWDDRLDERDDFVDALMSAQAKCATADRMKRRFKPVTIALRPLVRHLRVDRELHQERDWKDFTASEGAMAKP